MFKGHEFYSEKPRVWRKGLYAEEKNLIHEFLGGIEVCLGLKYESTDEARNACVALRRHCKKVSAQPVVLSCRKKIVYVTREENLKGGAE